MAQSISGAEIGVCVGRARISATELYWFWEANPQPHSGNSNFNSERWQKI